MDESFSQQFCTVAEVGAGGHIITGAKIAPCLVRVGGGMPAITQAPDVPVAQAPASELAIVTPPMIRRIGTATVIRIDGQLLSVAFDMVHSRQGGGFNCWPHGGL